MPRLFVAIDPPDNIKKNLETMFFGIQGARWVPLDQLHLTTRFIGEVDGSMFLDIKQVLEEARIPPFDIRLKGVGHFPPRGKPRVIWVGLDNSDPLQMLRKKIDSALMKIGVEPEGRKYSPHITLARLKNTPLQKVTNFLAGNGLFSQDPFEVTEFVLYSSTLTRKGAIHTVEKMYSLN